MCVTSYGGGKPSKLHDIRQAQAILGPVVLTLPNSNLSDSAHLFPSFVLSVHMLWNPAGPSSSPSSLSLSSLASLPFLAGANFHIDCMMLFIGESRA